MKRISYMLVALALWTVPKAQAQDAATEERLNQLSGKIEDLIAGQETQRKRIAELFREIESLREQHAKPNGSYASHEALKRLADEPKELYLQRGESHENTPT